MIRYTEEDKERVVQLRARHFHPDIDEEWPYSKIEDETGVSQERISAWLSRAEITGDDEDRLEQRAIELLEDDVDEGDQVNEPDELDEDEEEQPDTGDGDDVQDDDVDPDEDHPMELDEDGVDGFVPDADEPPPAPSEAQAPSETKRRGEGDDGGPMGGPSEQGPDDLSPSAPKQTPKQDPNGGATGGPSEQDPDDLPPSAPKQTPKQDPNGGPTGGPDEEDPEYVYEAECHSCGGTFGVEKHEIGEVLPCPWECGAKNRASRAGER